MTTTIASNLSFRPNLVPTPYSARAQACPPDTLGPDMVVLDDLDSVKAEQINDPWHFFREIYALKRYVPLLTSFKCAN